MLKLSFNPILHGGGGKRLTVLGRVTLTLRFVLLTTSEILGKIKQPEVTSSACFSIAPIKFLPFMNLDFV